MHLDFSKNHFELFGLEPRFRLDMARLDGAYLQLQSQVHPDRFANASAAEQRLSIQQAARVNEAYQTLKKPLGRARYLLQLHGVDTLEETNTAMPADFLVTQMEWREAITEAIQTNDHHELTRLEHDLLHQTRALENKLEDMLDELKNYSEASATVRKLKFLEKLNEEIKDAFETLEG